MATKKAKNATKVTHPLLAKLKVIFACVFAGLVALGLTGVLIWAANNN